MRRRVLDDRARDRVARLGMVHHQRRQRGIIARGRAIHPGDRLRNGMAETVRYRQAQRRALAAPVQRAQRMAHRRQPQRRAAALVGNREAVSADRHVGAVDAQLRDAARPQDQDRAVRAAMRAQVRDHRIGDVGDRRERPVERRQRLAHAGTRDAGDPHPRAHLTQVVGVQPRLRRRLRDRGVQRRAQLLHPHARIGRAGRAAADHPAGRIGDARAAMAAARVDPQEVARRRHVRPLPWRARPVP